VGRERTVTGKGNPNELGGGRPVPEDDGVVDYMPGEQLSWGTSAGGLRSKPGHRGPGVSPCRLGDPGAVYRGGLNAAALCC
jgi:hypothetical protein